MKKSHIKFAISVVIGVGLLFSTLKYFDLRDTVAAIRGAKGDYLLVAFALLVTAYLLRARRWMIWDRRFKYRDAFNTVMVGFMGNNVLPARLGEVLRAHCATAAAPDTFGRTATLASIAIERILDGFFIALLGTLGLFLLPLQPTLFWALALVCILFFILAGGLVLANYFHSKLKALTEKMRADLIANSLAKRATEKLNYFVEGLLLIRRPRTMAAAFAMTALIWISELLSYLLIAGAFFPNVRWTASLIFLAVVNFASLFPFTVGGVGAIEGATVPFLIGIGIPPTASLAMVVIQHGYQFFFTTLVGGVVFFANRYYELPIIRGFRPQTRPEVGPSRDSKVLAHTRSQLEHLARELRLSPKSAGGIALSIIIPAFNETNRLPKTILETIKWCRYHCPCYEIIVIDDGSTDETFEICRIFSEYDANVRAIANPHLGKGAAVRSGMMNASGSRVLFMDADGATPLEEIPKLMAKLEEGFHIAIGSRRLQKDGETEVLRSFRRKFIGDIFAGIVNFFCVTGIKDTQCGFKMFRSEVVKEICSRQKLNGFAFDVEILYLAQRLSLEISEVPIRWTHQEGSKVNLILDSVKMLRDILILKVLHINTLTSR